MLNLAESSKFTQQRMAPRPESKKKMCWWISHVNDWSQINESVIHIKQPNRMVFLLYRLKEARPARGRFLPFLREPQMQMCHFSGQGRFIDTGYSRGKVGTVKKKGKLGNNTSMQNWHILLYLLEMCYLEAKTGTVPYTLSTEVYPSSSFLPRDKLRERDRIGASRSRLTPHVCLPKKHHSKYFREMEVLRKVLWEESRDGDSAPLTETLHSQ